MNEHELNQAYERRLTDEWERYNQEGADGSEYDPYEEAEQLWEMQNGR